MKPHTVLLQYGTTGRELDLTGLNASVMRPSYPPALPDLPGAFAQASARPIAAAPLAEQIRPADRIAVVIPDITRALPTRELLTLLFAALPGIPAGQFTIVAGTGSHRGHSRDEWHAMVGSEIHQRYACVDHRADDAATLARVGRSSFGYDVLMDRHVAQADRRILLGFIEPHFMAGFSGGYKACFPGVADLDSIMHYHSAANIGHPLSTWGLLEGNPTQQHIRDAGGLLDHAFLVNVTLDDRRRVTGLFMGHPIIAHEQGCAFCKETVMRPCIAPFPIVVTTNSGYPLDQNLYQSIKGLCAAAEIVSTGGLIIAAACCNDGFPEHGQFKRMLFEHDSVDALLAKVYSPGFRRMDQWQVQKLGGVLKKAKVALRSELPDEQVRRAYLEPIRDERQRIDRELARIGRDAPIAVLPEGPLTIAYLRC